MLLAGARVLALLRAAGSLAIRDPAGTYAKPCCAPGTRSESIKTGSAGTDRGPLLTYELTVGRDVAEYWWEALIHAGDGLGLQPIGTEAMAGLERNQGV